MSSKKILIIDDEPDVVDYLTAILHVNGFETFSDSNVKHGIGLVDEIKPDLICLDIMMPQETGLSFYKKLRQNEEYKKMPVIIISGAIESGKFDFRSYIEDESISAPNLYLEKPIDIDEFIKNINRLTKN